MLPRDHLASEYDIEQTIEQQEEKVFDTSVHGQRNWWTDCISSQHLIITFNISGSGRYVDVSLMISLINDATGLCTVDRVDSPTPLSVFKAKFEPQLQDLNLQTHILTGLIRHSSKKYF